MTYLATLIHPATGDEQILELIVKSDKLADALTVARERREELKLTGYQVFELLPTN